MTNYKSNLFYGHKGNLRFLANSKYLTTTTLSFNHSTTYFVFKFWNDLSSIKWSDKALDKSWKDNCQGEIANALKKVCNNYFLKILKLFHCKSIITYFFV